MWTAPLPTKQSLTGELAVTWLCVPPQLWEQVCAASVSLVVPALSY